MLFFQDLVAENGATKDVKFSGGGHAKVKGKILTLRQILALFIKRFHHVRRSKKGFISEVSIYI